MDHELLVNLDEDNKLRRERISSGKPMRILMPVGGAGAGGNMFKAMIDHLIPYINSGKVSLYVNCGDHKNVLDLLKDYVGTRVNGTMTFINDFEGLKNHVSEIRHGVSSGIHFICHDDIFPAVYSTNLLMPVCDLLVTKPSELVYYPIPKIFMKHIGGHEVYGAINGREYGDSLNEYPTSKSINEMFDIIMADNDLIPHLCDRIDELHKQGRYNGAYRCVELASGKR